MASAAFQDNSQWPCFSGYKPLDFKSRQIRILTIGSGDEGLECSLEQVDLSYAQSYLALSYVWGRETNSKPVSINGEEVLIRPALWSFLSHLQKIKGTLRVWVDAICINQLDITERDYQVTMMAEIFRNACRVISWLGGAEGKPGRRLVWSPDRHRRRRQECLYEILSRPYWLRLWIMQEVAVAQKVLFMDEYNQATFEDLFQWVCEVRGLSQADFLIKSKKLGPDNYDLNRQSVLLPLDRNANKSGPQEQSKTRAGLQAFEALAQLRLSSLSIPLPRLVRGFRHAECQDPRDHIYGLLAMADAKDGARVNVDYSSPVLEVYLRNLDVWADESIGSYMPNRIEKVYDGHQAVNSLIQFVPASGPYCDIFGLQRLREDKRLRSRVVSKLCLECERIPGKPSYRTFAHYSSSNRRLVPLANDSKLTETSSGVYVSLVSGAFGLQGTHQEKVLYSTVKPGSGDIFMKLHDSGLTSNSTTLVLIARRHASHRLSVVGSGKLLEVSDRMIKPDVWLTFQMPDVQCEIGELLSRPRESDRKESDNTTSFSIAPGVKSPTYGVTFNGMAIAQMLEDDDYMAGFGLWDVFEFLVQHQLADVGQGFNRVMAPPSDPYHPSNSEDAKEVDEAFTDELSDDFNRYAPFRTADSDRSAYWPFLG